MAPEIVQNKGEITTKIDIWGVGVILYFLLTSEIPINGIEFLTQDIIDE